VIVNIINNIIIIINIIVIIVSIVASSRTRASSHIS